jgi:protein SCO1/2
MRFYANLALVVVVGFLGWQAYVIWTARQGDVYADCRQGVAGGAIGGPFTLVDQTGATVTEKEVLTKPALVYFGYTSCPDVCPLDNARNAEAVDILEEQGFEVTPVFITIDPARDTVEVMAEYVANFHPRMLGLTGSEDQIKAAAQAYKVYYKKQDSGDEYYLMDHSVFTYLMLPDREGDGTGFADFFKRDVTAQDMARSVGCFLQAR